MSVVHYYDMPQAVYLTTGSGGDLVNYPVSRSDIYFAKGVTNEIWFYLKDIDRRAVVLPNETLLMRIADREAGKVLLTLTLTLDDAAKARYVTTVPPLSIAGIDPGFYTYAMTRVAADGSERLLYADRSRTEFGSVEVREGPIPPDIAAVEVPVDTFFPAGNFLYSGAYPGPLQVGSLDGLMTAAVYGNGFTGNVAIQGTLDLSPSNLDDEWFDVTEASFTDLTGVQPMTITGAFTYVRFRVQDLTGQTALLPNTTGCVDCLGGNTTTTGTTVTFPAGTPTGFVKVSFRA
jgi:hypothetical protein